MNLKIINDILNDVKCTTVNGLMPRYMTSYTVYVRYHMFPLVWICISNFRDVWPRFCVCGYDFSAVWLIRYDSDVERFWKGWNISNPSFINILNQISPFWVGRSHDKFIYRCIILIFLHRICAISYGKVIRIISVSYTHLTLPTNREV